MRISIFGLGYVGAVSYGCLARDGHDVIGVDIDAAKLDLLRSGTTPVVESGMQELIANAASSGRTTATDDAAHAIRNSDISFICVGTPQSVRGDHNLAALEAVSKDIGRCLKEKDAPHLIVVRSTVSPGTTRKLVIPLIAEASGKEEGRDFKVCFQPEFLREGSSIRDYDNPPFTVVGVQPNDDCSELRTLFGGLESPFVTTPIENAEMLKFCCNAFHALKIVFANEVGRLSAALAIDARAVMELVCMDKQLNISTAYLRPGTPFGGSCLPKDVRAMVQMSYDRGAEVPLLNSLVRSNKEHGTFMLKKALEHGGKKVGVLGLSFKGGTDDLRESPLVDLIEGLIGKGVDIRIFDPEVNISRLTGSNKKFIIEAIPHISRLLVEQLEELVEWADVIIIGQNESADPEVLEKHLRKDQHVLDLVGGIDAEKIPASYEGILW